MHDKFKFHSNYNYLNLNLCNGILTIQLSNPQKKNAVTPSMNAELTTIWDDALRDPNVRLIILTGDGDDFCAGADFNHLNETPLNEEYRPTNSIIRDVRRHMLSLLDCEKPTIAKVRGAAYGIGASLALACDFIYAEKNARFCDPHVKAGMVAGDGGVLLWPALIGMARAKYYLMTGDPIGAQKAEEIGLITNCFEPDELDHQVQRLAEKLMNLPPHALNYTKSSLNLALKQMTGSAFETSLAYEIYSMGMNDCTEASTAFLEKRKPQYTGY